MDHSSLLSRAVLSISTTGLLVFVMFLPHASAIFDEGGGGSSSSSAAPAAAHVQAGGHHGATTDVALALTRFLAKRYGFPTNVPRGGLGNAPLTQQEIRFICAVRRSEKLMPEKGFRPDFIPYLSEFIAQFILRDPKIIEAALFNRSLCEQIEASLRPKIIVEKAETPFYVDAFGYPVSSNGFWNECIRNPDTPLSYNAYMENLMKNPDVDKYGMPRACSSYYSRGGNGEAWRMPESGLTFNFHRSTREYVLQKGFVVERQMDLGANCIG